MVGYVELVHCIAANCTVGGDRDRRWWRRGQSHEVLPVPTTCLKVFNCQLQGEAGKWPGQVGTN